MGAVPTSRIEKPRATYEDLLKVPDDKVAEIVDGELYVSPRPAAPQTSLASRGRRSGSCLPSKSETPSTYSRC